MSDAGFHRFPPPLDPTAQEFRPTYVYYPFPAPPTAAFIIPPPLPPPLPPSSSPPTRALLLTSVPPNVSESTVRRELEVFGDVRAVQMDRLRDGIVTVHFYDLRHATDAFNNIRQQHMHQQRRLRHHFDSLTLSPTTPPPPPLPARGLLSGRVIWAQFTFPFAAGIPDRYNQGSVVITIDSDVPTGAIRDTFEAFGDLREIREAPSDKNRKFVEFYDIRDASKAVAAVNGREIDGKPVVVEFNRPGGHKLNHYKRNKFIIPYRPPCEVQPSSFPSHLCGKDGLVEHGVVRVVSNYNAPEDGGLKKTVKSLYKHRHSPEHWVSRGGGSGGRNKPWKGPRGKCDPRFSIKDEAVVSSFHDSRTTVMIKNIPNKYSQKLLLNMLDNHCIQCNEGDNQPLSSYDFVYLPIDFVNKCNVGYGFVNMTSAEATWRLYKAFNHQNWEVFNSKKICEVSYARLQGLEALKEHFKNSKFPCEAEEYMPVVFTPPRDGRTLTDPIPIVGRSTTITSSTSSSTSSSSTSSTSTSSSLEVGCDIVLTADARSASDPTNATTTEPSFIAGGGDGDHDRGDI